MNGRDSSIRPDLQAHFKDYFFLSTVRYLEPLLVRLTLKLVGLKVKSSLYNKAKTKKRAEILVTIFAINSRLESSFRTHTQDNLASF
ncbi:hypothetical protein BpHYR1_038914 [Brachionus plicatilis]|uniref:Uncharacterized protein n=1 Tax=Brachionus plicatilis TaxID=10195 RepID=A0A3M7RZY6_BRAPC|nr:hypothetical protein BpHYR1_038914 [Brachionus plicatilis]